MGREASATLAYGIEIPEGFKGDFDGDLHQVAEQFGLEIEFGGDDKFLTQVVCSRKQTVDSYCPCEKVTVPLLVTKKESDAQHAKLKEFCEKTGVPWQKPEWYLLSLYL